MTLQDVFEAVHKLTDDDREAVAIVTRLLESGRIRRWMDDHTDSHAR